MEISRMDHKTHRAAHRVEGRSAAPGIARGPLLRLGAGEPRGPADALEASRLDLAAPAGKVEDEDAEAILAFQVALLEDENLAAPAFARITDGEAADRACLAA